MELETMSLSEVTFRPTDADWDILQRVRSLCPPAEVALKVIELARDPSADLAVLAKHIQLDPALTAQLLRTVNSAQFGLSSRINSVQRAVSMLGLKSLRLLATALSMLNPFSANLPKALYKLYWKKSLTTALVARELVDSATDDAYVAFTAGLLSDIGVLALAQVEGQAYQQLYQAFQEQPWTLLEEERRNFRTDHIRVGGLVLGEYGLDSQIVQAILSLADPDLSLARADSPLAQQLSLAHSMSGLWSRHDQHEWGQVRERLQREFGVDTDSLLDLITRVRCELHEWGQLFNLDVPPVDEAKFRAAAAEALVALSMDGAVELSIFESVFGHQA